MLSKDEMTVAMGEARDKVLMVMLEHERASHNGEPCLANRASAVAYMAHCLGVRRTVWGYAEELLMEYDALCEDTDCPHSREHE